MIGQTVSHYRIAEKIGEGGMGVVYLAEDTHLGRRVAIKFLSAAHDHNYRARFLREARAISSLSHPHIAIIHDYGETSDGLPFIVMEYIKGETLSELLHRSALTISRALTIIEAVAEALAAAHVHGIIHRDIKPSNVLVNEQGQVKVLDFGLVKQLHEEHTVAASLNAATLPAMRTSSNVVVGTPLYLSPEQAMGSDVDARSDLFALGALLYESLTGRPAFSGGSVIEIGAQIIHVNPPPPSAVNPHVPPQLDRITLKALEKKPEARYQSAEEMLAELQRARAGLKSEAGHRTQRLQISRDSHSSAFKSISETLRQPRISIGFFALALVLLGLGSWAAFHWLRAPAAPFQNMQLTKFTNTGRSIHNGAVISPDGKYVAHVVEDAGRQSLIVSYQATASNVVVVPPAEGRYRGLTFSNDGNYIYYIRSDRSDQNLLYQVPVLGGIAKKVMSNVTSPIAFSHDGHEFAFIRFDEVKGEYSVIIAQADGTAEKVLARRNNTEVFSVYGLDWSPDGKLIAVLSGHYANGFHMRVLGVNVADGTEKPISSRQWFSILQVKWLKDGSGLIMNAADESVAPVQIWYLSYPAGEATKITNDSSDYYGISLSGDAAKLVTVQSNRLKSIWVAPGANADQAVETTSGVGHSYGLAWTPDDKLIYSTMASGKLDLWRLQFDGTEKTQLTANAGANYHPAVSPDGRYIFFSSNRTGTFNIWRMDADGNNPKQLSNGGSDFYPDPSPDGQWIVYQSGGGQGGRPTLWTLSVDGDHPRQITNVSTSVPVISPDGRLIACRYWDENSGAQKIAIVPFSGGPPIKTLNIPIVDWQRVRWARDGASLTYIDTRAGVSNLWRQPIDGGPQKQLTAFKSDQIFSYDWSRDGKLLACERGVETSDVVLISSFQ